MKETDSRFSILPHPIALRLASSESEDRQIDQVYKNIAQFCQRWKVEEFYLFGSVLRDDFHSDSDIDVMVKFSPDARWGLLEFVGMKQELETMFDREVDLLTRKSIEQSENWIRRKEILGTARLVYVQR